MLTSDFHDRSFIHTCPVLSVGQNYTAVVTDNLLIINITQALAVPGYHYWYQNMAVVANGVADLAVTHTPVQSAVCGCSVPGVVIDNWPAFTGTPPPPSVEAFSAFRSPTLNDVTLGAGDGVEIRFDVPTNWGVMGVSYPNAASLSWLQPFDGVPGNTTSFGTAYTGAWVSTVTLRITFQDTAGCTIRPLQSFVQLLTSGGLKDYANQSVVSNATSGALTGSFVDFRLSRCEAFDGGSPASFANNDGIYMEFSMPTPIPAGTVWNDSQLNNFLELSGSFMGSAYTGVWNTSSKLYITITDVTGGNLVLTNVMGVLATVNLRDADQLSEPSQPMCVLLGGWKTGTCINVRSSRCMG